MSRETCMQSIWLFLYERQFIHVAGVEEEGYSRDCIPTDCICVHNSTWYKIIYVAKGGRLQSVAMLTESLYWPYGLLSLFTHFIHSWMALQPFVGPWHLLQFRNLIYTNGRTPWTRDQPVARPLPTQRTTHRKNAHTDIQVLSGIRIHDPTVRASEDSSSLRPRGHCDRPPFHSHPQINTWNGCSKSLRALLLHPEDGGDIFLRNVDYTALYPRWYNS
jgi:hypothetical protein